MGSSGGTIVITADRHEVAQALHWDDSSGSDFFFEPDAAGIAGTGQAEDLSDVGWTVTGLSGQFVEGSGSDFLSGLSIPNHYATTAALDLLQSPRIFADPVHAWQASHHLGQDPATLTMEAWNAFSVNGADETATGVGLAQAGGAVNVAANALAVIYSNGSNFVCRSSSDSDVGAAVDTAWHKWTIGLKVGTTDAIEWFIDGVSQGTLDLLENVLPMSWGAGVVTGGTNRVLIGPCRVFYR